jgi:uncharacterized membrane protein HdeD (DUF308 family)
MVKEMKSVLEKKPVVKKEEKARVSHKFVTALSIVSIIGFGGIVGQAFFDFDTTVYVESLLMFVVGIGLMIEARVKKLRSLSRGITSNNITHLTTVIIGFVALIAGIMSFPPINVVNPAFLAIKGIISIIAIVVIVIQTWLIRL